MIAFWLAAKAFFGGALKFLIENWKVVIPVLLFLYAAFKFNDMAEQRDNAYATRDKVVAAKALLETGIEFANKAYQIEDALIKSQMKISAENNQKQHVANLAKLDLTTKDRDKLRRELASEKDAINTILNDAYELRANADSSTSRAPKVQETACLSTEGGGNINTTLARVVRACQETTVNYNTLWQEWNDHCEIFGCE